MNKTNSNFRHMPYKQEKKSIYIYVDYANIIYLAHIKQSYM